ncbi:ribonuclease R [Trichloromonas sp.]|uniref:ribonuclease R n=1 Tax=Trichloromonas sp. TaxID=3069249 RepID=UPI002A3977E2|nr:ribonuclease R [Trichloromonas sp.]
MSPRADELLDFIARQARRPLSEREILAGFRLRRDERWHVLELLGNLVERGALIRHRNGRYSLPRQVDLVVGTISLHRDGYGFVAAPEGQADVFVPARYLREVMDGDKVAVRIERSPRDGKPEGRLVRIVERGQRQVIGRYEAGRGFGYVVPADPRFRYDLIIPDPGPLAPRAGQMVVARIDSFPSATRGPEGTVLEVLGDADDPRVEILAVAYKYELPHRFSAAVLAAAGQVPTAVTEADRAGRVDLRELPLVTIDGETAKDFDDAVVARREEGGGIRLWVAIADVGHYVPVGREIDREAYERGTSVYFPGHCLPMLPEALSNGICSLNPDVDRLVMTAEMLFDGRGQRLESRFYPALMRSRARLTYTEVQAMLDGGEAAAATLERFGALLPDLQVMAELAGRLIEMRRLRGSLDFDLPEAEVILGLTGKPESILRAERTFAHRLIEEFMLAANEAVATFLHERQAPLLYRIHEPPDLEKLQEFQAFAAHFNFGLKLSETGVDARELQKLLTELQGRPEEKLLNNALLRSLKQARYAPENVGHFGLAAELYCHFTSPIRRYPDLIVHRILREVLRTGHLGEERAAAWRKYLPGAGERTSMCERRAMEAEREIVALKKCQFMLPRLGEVFSALVSGVLPFGFFVELDEIFIEGLVHISSLEDDFYHYEEDLQRLIGEHRRRIFQVGMPLRVRLARVDLPRREIDFVLEEEAPTEGATRPRRKKGEAREETAAGRGAKTAKKRAGAKGLAS